MSNLFVNLLQSACARPIENDVFLEGYADVLGKVANGGKFDVLGLAIEAPPGVYPPHPTSSTRFFIDHFFALGLDKPAGKVLEIGCGAGAISLHAARAGSEVMACDIDPVAVEATLSNAALNGLVVSARHSDLFSAFDEDEKFDVIIFNLPLFHVDREIDLGERTLTDSGGMIYRRFMRDAKKHLAAGGRVIISFSNCSNTEILPQPGWDLNLRAFDFDAPSSYIRALFTATAS